MKLIVGIDFGTSTTVVRYREEGSNVIQAVKADNGKSEIIPSAIFKPADGGSSVYGLQALLLDSSGADGKLYTNFKIDLLDSQKSDEAKADIIDFLTFVYSLFEHETKALHPDKMDVYVSYPAKWSDDMVTFMKYAVETAGFKGDGVTVKGMKEPQAASLNMLNDCQHQLQSSGVLVAGKPLRVFMLDMGAGTSDISIFKLEIDVSGKTKISDLLSYPSISEPVLCGGREIDGLVQKYFIDLGKENGVKITPEIVDLSSVKDWKETSLSPCLLRENPVTGKNDLRMPSNVTFMLKMTKHLDLLNKFSIKRKDFERLSNGHWRKLYGLIRSAFKQYAFAKPEDIDIVFLTGGHSNWYVVPNLFNGKGFIDGMAEIGKDPEALDFKKIREAPELRMTDLNSTLPHESVARGLCLADENVEFEPRSANNVWAKIKIADSESNEMQIVDKNNILPKVQKISFSKTIMRHVLFEKHAFETCVNIYTGERLCDADSRCYEFNYDGGKSFWEVLLSILFVFPFFVKLEYELRVSMEITMTVEGELRVNGVVDFDNKTVLTFTEKNLKVV